MLVKERKHLIEAIEHIDLDRKRICNARRKLQEATDEINDATAALAIRLQNFEEYVNAS